MTVIDVSAAVTALGGRSAVQDGYLLVEYLRGADGHPSARMDGDTVLLPQTIRVSIVDGEPTEPVNVPPPDGECYARITIESVKPYAPTPLILSAVAVPPSGPVDISDLVAVDPSTYEPTTTVVTAWQAAIAQVNEASAIAGTFADRAEGAAGDAGTSAFNAGTSAAIALGHANDAKARSEAASGSATAASGSAGAAAGSAGAAAQSVTAAAGEREGARLEKVDAQAARAGAETARTGAETAKLGAETAQTGSQAARTGAETARTGAESARTGAEQARDVALTGQFAGSLVPNNADLNTYLTAGVYRVADSTGVQNLPFAGFLGPIIVLRRDGGIRQVQLAFRQTASSGADGRVMHIRANFGDGTTWGPWRAFTSQRVDQTAGRVIYTWDDVNNREQLIYGDTGWRDIRDSTIWGSGQCLLRRNGSVVTVTTNIGAPVAPGAFHAFKVADLPTGFRPIGASAITGFGRAGAANRRQVLAAQANGSGALTLERDETSADQDSLTSGSVLYLNGSWVTNDAWPTALPGNPVGGVST